MRRIGVRNALLGATIAWCSLTVPACSDSGDDSGGDAPSDEPGPTSGALGVGSGDNGTDQCADPKDADVLPSASTCEEERPAGATCLGSVFGVVVDEADEPVPDLPVTVCGPVCFRGVTDECGRFVVEMKRFVIVSEYSVQAHGSPHASTFYHPVATETSDGNYDAGTLRVVALPDDGDVLTTKLDLAGGTSPEQSVTSGAVTVLIGEGTVVRLSVGDALGGEEGKMFRAHELSSTERAEFAPELDEARVFALGPFEAELIGDADAEPSVALSVENTESWPADSQVEVLALGTYLEPSWLAPSVFEPIGQAAVSSDGARIELAADASGAGLRYFTWIALRPLE